MPRDTPLLGLSERWSFARRNINSAIIVIYHASIPDTVTQCEVQDAMEQLCSLYPLLLSGVTDGQTTHPRYTSRDIDPRDLVQTTPLDAILSSTDSPSSSPLTRLVEWAIAQGKKLDMERGPMIEVQLITPATTVGGESQRDRTQRLVIIMDHTLCDGVGAKNLLADLLNLLSGQGVPPQPEGFPARLDETVDLSPAPAVEPVPTPSTVLGSLRASLEPVAQAIGITTQPAPTAIPATFPPRQPGSYDSVAAAQQVGEFQIPASDLSGLLSIGKQYDVPTVHPIIQVASLMAMYRATQSIAPITSPGSEAIAFNHSCPMSDREETLGHPRSTGNYVLFHVSTDVIDLSTRFWEQARAYSRELRDPQTRIKARQATGKLTLIEGASSSPQDSGESEQVQPGPSRWEDYLMGMVNDPVTGPHKLAMAVSNVGPVDLPTEGRLAGRVDEVYFAQSASAMGATVVLSINSIRGGPLSVSLVSKRGSLPEGVFDAFALQLRAILTAVSRGDLTEDTVVGGSIPGVVDIAGR
ncbi:hypothetical protein IAU60_005582 [Kwoniella sp. DSM 27419]